MTNQTNQDTMSWAAQRLQIAQERLERAKNDERYSEWYKNHLRTRITYYAQMVAHLTFLTKQDVICTNDIQHKNGSCWCGGWHLPSFVY